MQYYQNLITGKSYKILQDFSHNHKFILIGGWAVFLYTKSLKSKDIDVIIDYSELEKLRQNFNLTKNDRLKKYEIIIEEVNIDIYLPFYSELGLKAEEIQKYTQNLEGFLAPKPEILLILKQKAHLDRAKTSKGEKDKIDIISLLTLDLDFDFYKKILEKNNLTNYLANLKNLLQTTIEVPELNLNQFQFSRQKKRIFSKL